MIAITTLLFLSTLATAYKLPFPYQGPMSQLPSAHKDASDLSFIENCERQVKRISDLLAKEGDQLNSSVKQQLVEAQDYLEKASKAKMESLSHEAKAKAHAMADELKAEAQVKINQGIASASEAKERALEEAKHLLKESKGHLNVLMKDAEREAKHELKRRIDELNKRVHDFLDETDKEK